MRPLLVLLACSFVFVGPLRAEGDKPNILVILVDDK